MLEHKNFSARLGLTRGLLVFFEGGELGLSFFGIGPMNHFGNLTEGALRETSNATRR